ncbi:hypothetical protein, partial [Clostridium sp. ZBS13]|uniref:hypothetical protein n=1 Tax=Clostridium sp. ZBS13 TaxID=2949971 RepID=UPI002079B1B1
MATRTLPQRSIYYASRTYSAMTCLILIFTFTTSNNLILGINLTTSMLILVFLISITLGSFACPHINILLKHSLTQKVPCFKINNILQQGTTLLTPLLTSPHPPPPHP